MSRDIWMRCAGPSRVAPLAASVWRVVEAQHRVSTRKLVDTLEEQQLLEQIVDQVKPSLPAAPEFAGLHYLLFTPFRHPPLLRGTRFGTATERSIWYGALRVETSLAEKAYYQLLFMQGSAAKLEHLICDWTAFSAEVATARSIDLTAPPFAAFQRALSSPTSYAATQRLGKDMRAAGVVAFTFISARCPKRGTAVGLFAPAFAAKKPGAFQTWKCLVTAAGCEVVSPNSARPTLVFNRAAFAVDGVLPSPSTTPS